MTDEKPKKIEIPDTAPTVSEAEVRSFLEKRDGAVRESEVERILGWQLGRGAAIYQAARETALCAGLPADLFDWYRSFLFAYTEALARGGAPALSPEKLAKDGYEAFVALTPGWALQAPPSLWVM